MGIDIVRTNKKYGSKRLARDISRLLGRWPALEHGFIGKSVFGRPIHLLKAGEGRQRLLMVGAHHGREYLTSTFVLRSLERLLNAGMPEGVELYAVPMLNPDGVNIALGHLPMPEGVIPVQPWHWAYKANGRGVDLNRNYPCRWNDMADVLPYPASERHAGPYPASEPETEALMTLCKRREFHMAVSFHTKGEVILWGDENSPAASAAGLPIARQLARATGYEVAPISDTGSLGGFENWFRAACGKPALCIELAPWDGTPRPYPMNSFDEVAWNSGQCIAEVLCRHLSQL